MPAPVASWGTHRVIGNWYNAAGTLLSGTAIVSLPVDVANTPQDAIIVNGTVPPVNLTSGGPYSLDVEVPANDDPDNLPQGWKPLVVVALSNGRTITYPIDATEGGTTNLRTVLNPQTIPSTADLLIVGVPGGIAKLSADGLAVLNADGDPITGDTGGGTALTSYVDQVESLDDYPTTFPPNLTDVDAADVGALPNTYTPPAAPTWGTLSGKPSVIAAGSSPTAARNAISAGTSNLTVGTGPTTAKAGNYTPSVADVPALPTSKVTGLDTALTGKASTAHAATHATDGTDALTPAQIGAVKTTTGTWIDHGTTRPPAGNEGRIFIVVPG